MLVHSLTWLLKVTCTHLLFVDGIDKVKRGLVDQDYLIWRQNLTRAVMEVVKDLSYVRIQCSVDLLNGYYLIWVQQVCQSMEVVVDLASRIF